MKVIKMEYIEKTLGIKVIYINKDLSHFPNYISSRYELKRVSLNEHQTIFVYPKTELESIESLKKHMERIQKSENLQTVLILKRITSRQKEYLIRKRIPFIVEGKQIYLPFMALYLQERCSAEKLRREKILPSAQMLLLYFIYQGANPLTTSQAAKELNLTPTSISRASRQLEEMGFVQTMKKGVQKILFSDELPEQLFQKAEKQLENPVKQTIYVPIENVKEGLLEGGYSALAEYSMLNHPNVKCYSTERISQWKDVMSYQLLDSKSQVEIEMWRYDPRKLSNRNTVDELSLALSLREDYDERVEEAVEEMLSNLWRRIDGYRNRKL